MTDDDQHIEDLDVTDEESGEVKGGFSWGATNPGQIAHKDLVGLKISPGNQIIQKGLGSGLK